jgi:hypothetical protein
MMIKAFHLTEEKRFLKKAIEYADISIAAIMDSESALG